MKKISYVLLLIFTCMLTACGDEETKKEQTKILDENQIYAYFVNNDKTALVPVIYTLKDDDNTENVIEPLIEYLENVETTVDYQTPIPKEISYLNSKYVGRHRRLDISFRVRYDMVDAETLLFFKGCVVKTFLQINGVDSVSLSLTGNAGETAAVVENFDEDSFYISYGDESSYKQTGTIVLYFANESGEALKEYRKTIEISNNTSLAKLVLESLIAGPEESGYQATLSEKTAIHNLSVKDGICYVDLSDEFYDTQNPLKNDIIIYSIVDSLVELPTVSKVQFFKNGEKQQFFRETMPFDGIFERNLDLIEQEGTEE